MFGFFRRTRPEVPLVEAPSRWQGLAERLRPRFFFERELNYRDALFLNEGGQFVVTRYELGDGEERRKLVRELSLADRIRHPSIVPILDWKQEEHEVWLIRPWVDGERLIDWLRPEPLEPSQVRPWFRSLVEALEACHSKGYVHGKISTKAIWLVEAQVLLGDLGLPDERQHVRVHTGDYFSGVQYLAPEFIMGHLAVPATDYYSLGAIMFHLLAGRPPFQGDPMQVIMRHVSEEAPRLSTCIEGIPPQLEELVHHLLVKKPEERLSSPGAILELLDSKPAVVQAASEEMRERLAELAGEGEAADCDRTFTLDASRALAKLREFQFAEPEAFIWPLCAAAHAWGCEQLSLQWSQSQLLLEYHGVSPGRESLESLWSYAFARSHRGLSHLALGLAGALALPGVRLKVASGGWGFQLQQLGPPKLRRMRSRHLTLSIQGRFPKILDREELQRRFGCSPTRLRMGEGATSRPLLSNSEVAGCPVYFRPDVRDDWQIVVDGLSFPLVPRFQPSGQVVVWADPLLIDLSYRRVVRNQDFEGLMQGLRGHLEQALLRCFEAIPPPDLGMERHYRYLQKTFGETCLDASLLHLARGMGAAELARAPLVTEAFERARHLPEPDPSSSFWELVQRKEFLSLCQPDWAKVEHYANRLFAPRKALQWKLRVGLEWRVVLPNSDQLEVLLAQIDCYRLEPEFDRELQEHLREHLGELEAERRELWRQLLPPDWVLSRQALEPAD